MVRTVPVVSLFTFALVLLACGCGKDGGSAAPTGTSAAASAGEVTYKTSDGWTIHADFYPAARAKKAIVLLHQRGGTAADWSPLIPKLTAAGITVLAIDQRGAGRSQGAPNGDDAPWETGPDIAGAVDWLKGKGLAENQISLAGASYGANNALIYAAAHPAVPSVVLLSPGKDYHGLTIADATAAFAKGNILAITASGDSITGGGHLMILDRAQHAQVKFYDGSEHGTALLTAHPDAADIIVKFLSK